MSRLALLLLFAFVNSHAQDVMQITHGCGILYEIKGTYKNQALHAINTTRNRAIPVQRFLIKKGNKKIFQEVVKDRISKRSKIHYINNRVRCYQL
jgi:hypothetical protein